MDQDTPDTASVPPATGAHPKRRGRRLRRILTVTALVVAGCLVITIGMFAIWANVTYPAKGPAIERAQSDPAVSIEVSHDFVTMTPTQGASDRGLVFLAGAKVEPEAYIGTFESLVASGTSVVIVRPFINLAIFETRPFEDFTNQLPDVERWAVGGHSQGGVKACSYAEDPEVSALVLLASYCSLGDLSTRTDLAALSVSGGEDRLVTPDKIADAAPLMPADSTYVELEGVSHAQFGSYGEQPGDGTPTVEDAEAQRLIGEALVDFGAEAETTW
ncbi:alpha/beta hydrolase [Leucobacter rhizosphaerae]|uniref:Alpha/beta hydrolase n=1 Tax=Leucobacter rhizosphaerae TaxID=2932245 RepID=A0ABY4FSY1_9MICO|nr:alpha/beta hydrolase [Leucobacter rhizosphaerae]UOQ59398.1 alpha/beta hydrolase [Leucobacter rhizosphaerae]